MNTQKVNAVLAQILLSASQLEDFKERELGPIHFIKYLYLADLVYAERHSGQTFTGIRWQFHHFGPWDASVNTYLEKGLSALGAAKKEISSSYGKDDFVRWSLVSPVVTGFAVSLDIEIAPAIDQLVKRFACHTPELLDFVYKTPPMLHAAPEEYLSFEPSGFDFRAVSVFTRRPPVERTEKQNKKLREWASEARARLAEKVQEAKKRRMACRPVPAPKYSEAFFQAMAVMDASDLPEIEPGEYAVRIDASAWKSPARQGKNVP